MIKPAPRSAPLGLRLITLFYMFGAVMLLVGLVLDPASVGKTIATAHGLSPIVGPGLVIVVAILALVMAYGLFAGAHWGFFLALGYMVYLTIVNLALGGLSLTQIGTPVNPIFFGNAIWSALVSVYLLMIRGYFWNQRR